MKLTVTTDVNQNNYSVEYALKDISPTLTELIKDYGEIEINLGGEITVTELENFTLGNEYKKLPSALPFEKVFTEFQYKDKAVSYAEAFVKHVDGQIKAKVDALKLKDDTFSKITEVQY